MKRSLLLIISLLFSLSLSAQVVSPTEGVITHDFVPEAEMQTGLLQMLADFTPYMVADWNPCVAPNSEGEECGFFRGENSGGSDERGVRPNADLSMICAFLVRYAKPQGVALPEGISWSQVEQMARQSLIFAYSTHKANRLKVCAGNGYWGSTAAKDAVWESSLWAMSVAYSAFFQWDSLTAQQRSYVYQLLRAECNYELERSIPTGFRGDTKAEENGWEADVLAATLGLFPDDALAPQWFARLREFAINSYSHPSDSADHTVIDPDYDQTTVAQLYRGANLYADYTLQNHNLFHTSYQNVVMQELGEAALALSLFQRELHGSERWHTNALMHHNQQVMDSVLCWLALADGELAMPNGNDWSLFLYDQITSYSTQACFGRDANALMLENLSFKYIRARQTTTPDGSWLLRADVGARRMGVEAHRVMMTWLMHHCLSTADLQPTTWPDFSETYSEARLLPCQNVVRASSPSRFTTFSWSEGLRSYTGYIAANSPDRNKIIVPYRANNTGNFLGWYEVSGRRTDAQPVLSGKYQLMGNAYVMNGELLTNGSALNNRFAIYSTPSNAVIYLDHVTALDSCTITAEKGGLLAISVDELTRTQRDIYVPWADSVRHFSLDGSALFQFPAEWVNIDNEVGVVGARNGKQIAFGGRSNNNSILTAKLYPLFSDSVRTVVPGAVVDARGLVYYSLISAEDTELRALQTLSLKPLLPAGWNGLIAPDEDCPYLLISNFRGETEAAVQGLSYQQWAPVLSVPTVVEQSQAFFKLHLDENSSLAQPLRAMIQGSGVVAIASADGSLIVKATRKTCISVSLMPEGAAEPIIKRDITLRKGKTLRLSVDGSGNITANPI